MNSHGFFGLSLCLALVSVARAGCVAACGYIYTSYTGPSRGNCEATRPDTGYVQSQYSDSFSWSIQEVDDADPAYNLSTSDSVNVSGACILFAYSYGQQDIYCDGGTYDTVNSPYCQSDEWAIEFYKWPGVVVNNSGSFSCGGGQASLDHIAYFGAGDCGSCPSGDDEASCYEVCDGTPPDMCYYTDGCPDGYTLGDNCCCPY